MSEQLLLGIDLGTSRVKSVLFDRKGSIRGMDEAALKIESPVADSAEQDMEHLWVMTAKTVSGALKKGKADSTSLAAVGVAGQGTGCWLLDENKEPLGRAITWLDGRSRSEIEEWRKDGRYHQVFELTGNSIFPGSPASILSWLKKTNPQTFEGARFLIFAKDWVKFKLTGKLTTDPSDMSVFPRPLTGEMAEVLEMLDLTEVERMLCPVESSTAIIGEVTEESARLTGLSEGTPVVGGVVDVVASAISLGVLSEGQAFSIVGTTCFNGILTGNRAHLFEPQDVGISVAYPVKPFYVKAMGTMAGTLNLDWFVEKFLADEHARFSDQQEFFSFLEKEIQKIPPGSDGLIYHPYLSPGGERAPFVEPLARAQFSGLSHLHTRYHFLRAVYEGVAFSILDCFHAVPQEVSEIRIAGGGAKSGVWGQIIADVLGIPVIVPRVQELGALGAALTAGVGVGIYSDLPEAVQHTLHTDRTYYPDGKNFEFYQEYFELYLEVRHRMTYFWQLRGEVLERWRNKERE